MPPELELRKGASRGVSGRMGLFCWIVWLFIAVVGFRKRLNAHCKRRYPAVSMELAGILNRERYYGIQDVVGAA